MFFLLSKALSFCASPTFWIISLFLAAYVLRKKKVGKRVVITAIGFLLIFTNSALFYSVAKQWETPYLQQSKPTQHYIYGIVLGGMAGYDTISHRIQFSQSSDRLFQALILLKDSTIDTLVISGGSAKIFEKERFEATYLKEFCIKIGFDSAKILVDSLSRSTLENAINTSKLIQNKKSCNCLLISSSYHLPRALACFRKKGFIIDGYGTDALTQSENMSWDNYLRPSLSVLLNWDKLLHEWIGYGSYWLKNEL